MLEEILSEVTEIHAVSEPVTVDETHHLPAVRPVSSLAFSSE